LKQLQRGIIISCQLEPEDPIKDVLFIVNMSQAAKWAGAVAIRTNGPTHVQAVKESVSLPVIGLMKDRKYETFITPTFEHAKSVIEAGADFVAIDCTRRRRPLPLRKFFDLVRNQFPDVGIIADIADEKDAELVAPLEPDYFATTLSTYVDYTSNYHLPNIALVGKLSAKFDVPVIAEGGYSTLKQVELAFRLGAYAVVIGTAITRPWLVIKSFVDIAKALINNGEG